MESNVVELFPAGNEDRPTVEEAVRIEEEAIRSSAARQLKEATWIDRFPASGDGTNATTVPVDDVSIFDTHVCISFSQPHASGESKYYLKINCETLRDITADMAALLRVSKMRESEHFAHAVAVYTEAAKYERQSSIE